MKKNVIIAIAAMMALYSAAAQDTIIHNGPLANYYCTFWFYDADTVGWQWVGLTDHQTDYASRFDIDDTMTVYGIAAMLGTEDTLPEKITEYMRLYYPGGDTLRRHAEQLPVNMGLTPISYYLLIKKVGYHDWPPDSMPPFAVYERYFETPVTVVDTFYVGYSNETHRITPTGAYTNSGVDCIGFLPRHFDTVSTMTFAINDVREGWWFRSDGTRHRFVYPILTPPDTSLAVPDNSLVARLTGVMPNPAAETAKVVSSMGLTAVEAYNMAGEKVCAVRLPEPALTTTLDVSRWPQGTYLLRIHTPQGTATKKLSVIRK